MYVTARATPARRGIDHNAKQKTLLKRSLAKPQRKKVSLGFFFLMPSVERSTLGCEAVAAERAVRMRMNFASISMRAKPTQQKLRG